MARVPIADSYGAKQTVLIEKATEQLQAFLETKKEKWEELNKDKDFFQSHGKKWNDEELEKIDRRNIGEWDISLCAKWLLNYPKGSDLKIPESDPKRTAIDKLRKLRNKTGHNPKCLTGDGISVKEFQESCEVCKDALKILGVPDETIRGIILQAEDKVNVIDRKQLQGMLETPWEYTSQDILGVGCSALVIKAQNIIDHSRNAVKIIPIPDFQGTHSPAFFDHKVYREAKNLHKLNRLGSDHVIKYKSARTFQLTPKTLKNILLLDSTSSSSRWKDKALTHELSIVDTFKARFHDVDVSKDPMAMVKGLYIVTEVCGETIRQWMKCDQNSDKKEARNICSDIMKGLKYVHSRGIIHRDLRPDNIFFSKEDFTFPVKIGDFGMSVQQGGTNLSSSSSSSIYSLTTTRTQLVGHHLYRAPEMKTGKYNQAVDLFSFGLTISEVFDPVEDIDVQRKLNKIIHGRNTGNVKLISGKVHEVIIRLTEDEACDRGSLEDIDEKFWLGDRESVSTASEGMGNLRLSHTPSPSPSPSPRTMAYPFPSTSTPSGAFRPIFRHPESSVSQVSLFSPPPVQSSSSSVPSSLSPSGKVRNWLHSADDNGYEGSHSNSNASSRSSDSILRYPMDNGSSSPAPRPPVFVPIPLTPSISGSSSISDDRGILLRDDIVNLRKTLQRDKQFWTSENIIEFLDLLDNTKKHELQEEGVKHTLNHYLYRIFDLYPSIVTKGRLKEVLIHMGFANLIEKIEKLHFQ